MQVINIGDLNSKKRKKDLLEILDDIRKKIDDGEIEEFVISSIDNTGEVQVHVCVKDIVGGVGLFEIGKNILILQQSASNYE